MMKSLEAVGVHFSGYNIMTILKSIEIA